MKKYELTDETITIHDVKLHRIRSLIDIVDSNGVPRVSRGSLGGFIESEKNLSHYGSCWIYDTARAYGESRVSGEARLSERASVFQNASIRDKAFVSGQAVVRGESMIYENAFVHGRTETHSKDNSTRHERCKTDYYAAILMMDGHFKNSELKPEYRIDILSWLYRNLNKKET